MVPDTDRAIKCIQDTITTPEHKVPGSSRNNLLTADLRRQEDIISSIRRLRDPREKARCRLLVIRGLRRAVSIPGRRAVIRK